MYKLLVVDDEYFIRDCVTTTIDWESIGVEVVGTAIDGADAIKKVELLCPDIVITDVRMNNIDGLEFSETLRDMHPFIKVIIMSGYDDFEYIKKALEIKVFSYILKPMRPIELIETVQNTIKAIEDENKLASRIQQMEHEIDRDKSLLIDRFLFDLINGNYENYEDLQASIDFLNTNFSKDRYLCTTITISDYHEILKNSGLRRLHSHKLSIKELLNNMLSDYEIWTLMGDHGSLNNIIGNSSFQIGELDHKFVNELEELSICISKFLGITVSISIGGVYSNLLDISKSYEEALLASEHSVLSGGSGIIHINDLSITGGSRYVYPSSKESLLLRNLFNSTEIKLTSYIKELFHEMLRQNCPKDRMRIDVLGLMGKLSGKAMDLGVDMYSLYNHKLLDPYNAFERYHSYEQIENWLINIVLRTVEAVKNNQDSQLKSVILKANKYLQENYANPNLNLEFISSNLFLNPTYFSRLYKKETGENYVDSLKRIRIEKAKYLLKESNQKISDIAEIVGYPNSKYFYAIFKKCTGLTPVEFREK
jgi:two-component system response regulator YesN